MSFGGECSVFRSSFDDCIRELVKLNADVMQTYLGLPYATTLTRNQKIQYMPEEARDIKNKLRKYNIKLYIHSSLTINLTRDWEDHKYRWMWDNLEYDMNLGHELGAKGVVVHLGTQLGHTLNGAIQEIHSNIIKFLNSLNQNKKYPLLLLETPAQTGTRIGYDLETLAFLMKLMKKSKNIINKIGICVDTQHIFSAGEPIHDPKGLQNYFKRFNKLIGLKYWKLIHLNDSMVVFHGQRDRHQTIGEGYIFDNSKGGSNESFELLCTFAKKHKIPMILETPNQSKIEYEYGKKCSITGGTPHNKLQIVLKLFNEIKDIHERLGNVYEAKAYGMAIKSIMNTNIVGNKIEDYKGLAGIGKGLLSKIEEILNTNRLQILDDMRNDPKVKSILTLSKVRGIGPKMAKKLYESDIKTIDDLKKEYKLSDIQKFWIDHLKNLSSRIPRKEVKKIGEKIEKKIKTKLTDVEIILGGSYRLGKSDSGDVDILVVTDKYNIDNVLESLKSDIEIILETSTNGASIIIKNDNKMRQIDLRIVKKKELPFYLLFFGSGMEFSRYIRGYAKQHGWKLTDKTLKRLKDNYEPNVKSEEDIFTTLGLNYVPPEKR